MVGGVIGLPLATVMGYRPPEPHSDKVRPFGDEFKSAVATPETAPPRDVPAPAAAVGGRREIGDTAGSRQANTNVSPAVVASAAREPAELDWIAPIPAARGGSVRDLENPIPKVQDLLVKLGVNPAQIQFELLDDVNSNPLGPGHVNHLMRVRMPNGWKEDFAVEYIHRNPSITANEIVSLSRRPVAPPHLQWV